MKPVMDYKPNTVLKQGHTETEVGEKTVSTRKLLVTQNKRNTNRTTEGEGKLKTEHPVPSTKFRESRLIASLGYSENTVLPCSHASPVNRHLALVDPY